jgi:hypothetical protein
MKYFAPFLIIICRQNLSGLNYFMTEIISRTDVAFLFLSEKHVYIVCTGKNKVYPNRLHCHPNPLPNVILDKLC